MGRCDLDARHGPQVVRTAAFHPIERGFTLLEVMVAVAIFAVVAALAWGGLDTLARSRHALDAESARLAALQRAVAMFERDLRQVAARPVRDGSGQTRPALFAGGDGIEVSRFVGQGGWVGPSPQVERIDWQCRDGRLLRARWPALDRAPATRPEAEALLDGIDDCRWRFVDDGAVVAAWPPQEADVAALPRGVEFRFRVDGVEYRRLLELPQSAEHAP
ncbi:MAG: type II secretion system minor pseudopilin GspJ [Rehaibacterium terrae]|uniref:type II secretion system minor pseudopilin GspJ n=1 Tax=Rehaibacterium terrae TaxID=1341696 RepID=UPI00391C8FA2